MAKPNYLAVWIYLLVNANFEDREVIWNNKKNIVKRGQFIGSLRQISEHYKIGIATVSYILKYFISEHMIEQSSNKRFTLFTITNYDMYQEQVEQQIEIKVKSNRNQSETTKNIKNIKKEKIYGFVNLFNEVLGTHYKGDSKTERQFNQRMKDGYTLEDFRKAIENASADKFLMGDNDKGRRYLTPEYITRSDKLEQWLNVKKCDSKNTYEGKEIIW